MRKGGGGTLWKQRGGVRGGLVSECDETHLGMNAGPFISLFSGIRSKRLMERADKEGRMRKSLLI